MKINPERIEYFQKMIEREFTNAVLNHSEFKNAHEGYAVLLEEVEELWNEIKKNKKKKGEYPPEITGECVQVAAMALRFLYDLT